MRSLSDYPLSRRLRALLAAAALSLAFAGPAFAAETVDINTADAETINQVLSNIGPAKAQAIVDYRDEHGPFKSADQLAQVKGIGLKTVEKNRDRIEVKGGGS